MSHTELPAEGSFYPSVDALAFELLSLFNAGEIDAALTRIQAFVQAVILDRRAVAKVFADPVLDEWCQRIGAAVFERMPAEQPVGEAERPDCVILATELYRAGGHSAVIEDLIGTGQFGPRIVVMLTDALHTADPQVIGERLGDSVRGEIAPRGSLADKLNWTLARLDVLHPRRLVLFNHHHDPVAIAAARPGTADETVFYHHADHQLCLGVTLKHALHVDPHPMGFHNCRHTIGIKGNVYWPLSVEDRGRIPVRTAVPGSGLRTCSSGSKNKFDHDYKYQYADLLPRVLAITQGTHVHIGPLSDEMIERIHRGLDALNVRRTHFMHIPWVSSVWDAFRNQKIDLYIASFPLGGGRVTIEAMGAGLPIVAHDCYRSPFLGGKDMLYQSAFVWRHPEQLLTHLSVLRSEQLAREGQAAREHYERYHTLDALTLSIDAGHAGPPAPPTRPHVDDPLQVFLDDVHYALRDHLTFKAVAPVLAQGRRFEHVQKVQTDAMNLVHAQEMLALMRRYSAEINRLDEGWQKAKNQIELLETRRANPLANAIERIASLLRR